MEPGDGEEAEDLDGVDVGEEAAQLREDDVLGDGAVELGRGRAQQRTCTSQCPARDMRGGREPVRRAALARIRPCSDLRYWAVPRAHWFSRPGYFATYRPFCLHGANGFEWRPTMASAALARRAL